VETDSSHHVHHIQPFRTFETASEANKISNLVTLCPRCHRKVEINQKIRSGLSGLRYLVRNMAPLYLMCDYQDIEVFVDPSSLLCEGHPIFLIYENIPHGIGLSNQMFIILREFLHDIFIQIEECPCSNGCPSCVGPEPEAGYGGKLETRELLKAILG
jgi:DEAD/DEAH box helicase domain-containing protein